VTVASIETIPRSDLRGQRVLVRIDAEADTNLLDALPTLSYLSESGARLVITTHSRRPDAPDLDDLIARLSEQLGRAVSPLIDWRGETGLRVVTHMGKGQVIMLGDLALEAGEETNDETLADALARLCDIYCNAAFALSHEVRVSTVGVVHKAKRAVAAHAFARELMQLELSLNEPPRPLYAILGGELSKQKLLLAEEISRRAENLLVAGEICLPFLVARGFVPGNATVADELVRIADRMMSEARDDKRDITTPVDFTVADQETLERLKRGERFALEPPLQNVRREEIQPEQIICDIGDITRWGWSDSCGQARTIFWHGPLGICELEPFTEGTRVLAMELVSRTWPGMHKSMICGSSLSRSLRQMGIATEQIGYLTTAGRAVLHYFAGRPLPAVEALRQAARRRREPFRILIPLDGSTGDRHAIEVAAEMATSQSEIHLLHVRRGPDEEQHPDFLYALSEAEKVERRLESERIFAQANTFLASHGLVSANQLAAQGKPAKIILRYAKQMRAGLIVVTANAADGTINARQVIDHATCAVLVAVAALDYEVDLIAPTPRRARRILLAVDGSEHSLTVASRIGSLVDAEGAEIHLLYVQKPKSIVAEGLWVDPQVEREREIERQFEAERIFAAVNAALARQGLVSHMQIDVEGDPADEILRFADEINADLIAMGSHGKSGVLSLIMGSVSRKVIDHARCPVLVAKMVEPEKVEAGPVEPENKFKQARKT
jgi:phosphoglycerate kinase